MEQTPNALRAKVVEKEENNKYSSRSNTKGYGGETH
jgi:hypothetical protein